MDDWYKGFVSGALATVFGFGLTMVWDILKNRRESKQKDGVILSAIFEELTNNHEAVKVNLNRIKFERYF